MSDFGPHFELYQDGFRSCGLTITRAESHESNEAYRCLGDVVYMLQVTPWTIPEFNLEQDLDALLALEQSLLSDGGIVLTNNRYIIEAYKQDA